MKLYKILISTLTLSGIATFIWFVIFTAPVSFVVSTMIYSKGYSYLSDDPKACVNCHVMQDHFYAYEKSSHHAVANCNSCHTPEGFLPKYLSKAVNGWNHGVAFTTGDYPWPLKVTQFNRNITNKACLKCHSDLVHNINIKSETNCIQCHSEVGHMK
ncbi:cytochrome c nitrite reductase small subunit [Bacteriovorax sp. Seq25_V]|uniref:cytochrome c nitrite reductase small subunit n=1 Tax=Bacteriovorax sp. Seq25_V TaxID=1201288 RepID=UPI00038A3439|nr:cytochrome c nitrite reductase small subunit [Bacteriovorax sp. Seq25_V]EQC47636.1 cytochrome c nitrate reductase, small subunit [Bacteriovorax sp. Seq25_V]